MIDPNLLVRDSSVESSELEFKQTLPGRTDRDRHEFLKDVCAFANSGGGTIYFGIAEESGAASRLKAITDESFDDASRRLGQILDSGIEPRLRGINFHHFEQENGYIIGLRVAPSFGSPHRYLFNGHSRFVLRNNTHVTEMNYDQLRSAFSRNSALIERAQTFWESAVQRASNRKTWRPIAEGPLCLMQIIPLPSLEVSQLVNVQDLRADFAYFMFSDWGGASASFNLEGLVVHTGDASGNIGAFVQVNRNGIVQAYRSGRAYSRDEKLIPSQTIAEFIREATAKFFGYIKKWEIPGPYVLNCALLDVADYRLAVDNRLFFLEPLVADRRNLLLPSVYLESLADQSEDAVAKDILDVLWQSFGVAGCTYYNADGVWNAR